MSINAQGYFNQLKSQIRETYAIKPAEHGVLILSEKPEPESPKQTVKLKFTGDAFAIKLDKHKSPLFHFLEDKGHPWSKRCDFVVFHRKRNAICAICIEFKTARTNIPVDKVVPQLNASACWCRSLHNTVRNYTGSKRKIHISKYLFTACLSPDHVLDETGKYLRKDSSIRHYTYDQVNELGTLEALEHESIETIH